MPCGRRCLPESPNLAGGRTFLVLMARTEKHKRAGTGNMPIRIVLALGFGCTTSTTRLRAMARVCRVSSLAQMHKCLRVTAKSARQCSTRRGAAAISTANRAWLIFAWGRGARWGRGSPETALCDLFSCHVHEGLRARGEGTDQRCHSFFTRVHTAPHEQVLIAEAARPHILNESTGLTAVAQKRLLQLGSWTKFLTSAQREEKLDQAIRLIQHACRGFTLGRAVATGRPKAHRRHERAQRGASSVLVWPHTVLGVAPFGAHARVQRRGGPLAAPATR